MALSQFRQKLFFAKCSIYNFSLPFFGRGGRGGDKTFPKVSPKFWQNFISSKFKTITTLGVTQNYPKLR